MTERFSYGSLGEEQTEVVLDAYRRTRSCLRASLQTEVPVSSATVSRVVNAALEQGVLDPGVKRGPGRPKVDRGRILSVVEEFPAATLKQQARLAGCHEYTIYRALRETNGVSGD